MNQPDPRIHYSTQKPMSTEDAEDALELLDAYGMVLDPFQRLILTDWLMRASDGHYSHGRAGLSLARQNGKSEVLAARIIIGMIFFGEKMLFTAHVQRSSKVIFQRLVEFFQSHPDLEDLLVPKTGVRYANGQESITLKNGGQVSVIARTKGSGRGFTVDTLILDEAQDLNADSYAALLPTISAAPQGNPQVIMAGTAPAPNSDGEVFTKLRDSALDALDNRLSWIEWSAEEDDDLDDEDIWRQCNPALGTRLSMDTILGERNSTPDDIFGRERLNIFGSVNTAQIIDPDVWASRVEELSQFDSELVLAVDMSPNRSSATIAVAGYNEDGKAHVEVIDHRAGTGWLISRVIELTKKHDIKTVVLDDAGPAMTLADDLKRKHKIKVTLSRAKDMAVACGLLMDGINEGSIVHLDQPNLNIAIKGARKRKLGDAFAFARATSTADITPLVAITLAHWGVRNSKVKKTRSSTTSTQRRRVAILR